MVTPAGDEAVTEVAQGPWNPVQDVADRRPGTWEFSQQSQHGIGANEDLFRGGAGIPRYDDGIGDYALVRSGGVRSGGGVCRSVTGQQFGYVG